MHSLARQPGMVDRDDLITIAMAHQKRRRRATRGSLDGGRHEGVDLRAHEQPRRQGDDTGQLVGELGRRQAREHGHGPALREAAEHDPVHGDAVVDLGLDQALQEFDARLDPFCVLGFAVQC